MVFLREKVNFRASRKLPLREVAYYTVRHMTMLPLHQIKETEMEIRTKIMVIMSQKDGEGKPRIINPDSSAGIFVTASVKDE